ncbi:MAG: ketopantoate reductase family protein [Lachnospiraceae bacterium]|nr:ketopantoate reductase family protein [Lachnospiraceae bacterium]
MKIAILGAGATGCNVGGHLKLGGESVYLLDPFEAHMTAIRENGLIWHDGDIICDPIFFNYAGNDAKEVGPCDVVIVQTKNPFTRAAIEGHREIFDDHTHVITLQNGLGTTDALLEYFPPERIGYGILYSGGQILEPGHIQMLHSDHNIMFRRLEGSRNDVYDKLLEACEKSNFPSDYNDNIDHIIWTKVGVNCFCNMPCGITRLTMKKLLLHPSGNALVEKIVDEVVAVAHAKGVEISADDVLNARTMCLASPVENYPSGSQDVMHKRQTEVESLNGAVARIGKEVGVPTPVNETIAELIRVIQDTYADQF